MASQGLSVMTFAPYRAHSSAQAAPHRTLAAQVVLVQLHLGQCLSFAGTEDPAAYGTLLSIGAISPSENKATSKLISDILLASTSVPPNRFYLSVSCPGPPSPILLQVQPGEPC
jgi:hypothetical protein